MWKINFTEDGRNRIGAFDDKTGKVKTSDGATRNIKNCENANFHEKYSGGRQVKPRKLKLFRP